MEATVVASELSNYSMAVAVMCHFLLQIPVKVVSEPSSYSKAKPLSELLLNNMDMLCISVPVFEGFFNILIEFVTLSYIEEQQCFIRISYFFKLTLFLPLNKFYISGRVMASLKSQ